MQFYTSDHHLGHLRIPELAGRPFTADPAGVVEMNTGLIRRHNERVQPGDEVYLLGDFAMGTIAETLPLVRELHGDVLLLAGNHDRCSPCYWKKWPEWVLKYQEAGFHGVLPMVPPHTSMARLIAGESVQMSHFPYAGSGEDSRTGVERFPGHRPVDRGGWLLNGHVHSKWRQRGRMINVGVDAWGGYPVSETEIAALLNAGPNDLEALPW